MSYQTAQVLHSNTPCLDLHGEVVAMVNPLVIDFLNTNYKSGNYLLRIVHGKSTNILTKEVHAVLKAHKQVNKYMLNGWNIGETIVYLNKK